MPDRVTSAHSSGSETCWVCHGTRRVCTECWETECTEAAPCRTCGATGSLPTGTSMQENGEPPPGQHAQAQAAEDFEREMHQREVT